MCLVREIAINQGWLHGFGWAAERIALLSTEGRKTANNDLKCKFNELFPVMLLNIVMYPTFLFKSHPPEVLVIVVSWVSYFNLWLLHLPHQHFFLYWFLHVHMSPRLFLLSCSLIIYSCQKSYIYLHPSEKAMAPHSSTLAWKIPWTEEPGRLQSMGSLRVRHDWATSLSLFTFMHWRRKWQPTPVFLPGESQGREAWWAAIYGVAQSQTQLKRHSSSSSNFHPFTIILY